VTDDAGHPAALRVEPPGGDEVGRHDDELVPPTGHGEVGAERVGDDGPGQVGMPGQVLTDADGEALDDDVMALAMALRRVHPPGERCVEGRAESLEVVDVDAVVSQGLPAKVDALLLLHPEPGDDRTQRRFGVRTRRRLRTRHEALAGLSVLAGEPGHDREPNRLAASSLRETAVTTTRPWSPACSGRRAAGQPPVRSRSAAGGQTRQEDRRARRRGGAAASGRQSRSAHCVSERRLLLSLASRTTLAGSATTV